jgi:CheY-like chemotaxis protein
MTISHPVTVQPLKVLAVDDDPMILINLTLMLTDMGHTVLESNSVSTALEILRGDPAVDLIVTDYLMSAMSGNRLVDEVLTFRPGLPIVLTSGLNETPPSLSERVHQLQKPYTEEQLEAAIAEAFADKDLD